MSIQIVKLRPKPNAEGPRDVTEIFKSSTARSTQSLFQNIERLIDDIPEEERYNLFFTLSHTKRGSRTGFEMCDVVAFDIDDIALNEILSYHAPIEAALGIDLKKCVVIHSGNGIQILVKIKEVTDKDWFKKNKEAYKYWCDRINSSLEAEGLPGNADTTVFEAARILRLPLTENRKPIWNPHAEDSKVKKATLFNSVLEDTGFKVESEEVVARAETKKVVKQIGKPDAEFIMQECAFMKFAMENQEELEEPMWYAALGVAAFFQDEDKIAHEISKNHPDYIFEDCQEKLDQARNNSGARTCEDISSRFDGCKSCPYNVKTPLQIKSKKHIATAGCGFSTVSPKGRIKRHPEDLRLFFELDTPYKTVEELSSIMVWQDNHFQPMGKTKILAYAKDKYEPISESNTERLEFYHQLRTANVTELSWFTESESTRGKINLMNGALEVKTGELLPHSPKYSFQYILPYEYNANAKCPTWDQLLKNVMDDRQDKIDLLEEYLGFILFGGEYDPNVALILSGSGNNGKTSLLNAIRMVVGQANVSDTPVKSMSQRFGCSNMEGKLVNICEEEGPDCFKDTSNFKKATGSTMIEIEKKFEGKYSMLNRAKLILSFNETPHLSDTTEGMQRRLLILPMTVNLALQPEKRIDNLMDKLKEELPGILNRGLLGLKRMQENKGFSKLAENGSLVRELVHQGDPTQWFWDDFCKLEGDDPMSMKELFEHFQAEMEAGNERYNLSFRGFAKKIKKITQGTDYFPKMLKISGKTMLGIKGLKYVNGEAGVLPHDQY